MSAALTAENILGGQSEFRDLLADLSNDRRDLLLSQRFRFLLQLFKFCFDLPISTGSFCHRGW
ncbi:hypothetical protein WI92_14160 [Burkholderia vietnamiensis]|nr:hypothetical protein WI92_14160 [Burkholderia vietnamiensis]